MDPVTNDDIVLLFDGKTREECLEIALHQILGTFDTPIARLKFKGTAYVDAIRIARYALLGWEEKAEF